MTRMAVRVGAAAIVSAAAVASAQGTGARARPAPAVERGRYLVSAMGCGDCHTPKKATPQGPVPDESRLLSGHPESQAIIGPSPLSGPWIAAANEHFTAWTGPWGVSFAANLTPDQNTGLGIWTEEIFVNAMRTGRHYGVARPILPPMPWPNLARLSDADLRAVYAYLRSIPPVRNRVPAPLPPASIPQAARMSGPPE